MKKVSVFKHILLSSIAMLFMVNTTAQTMKINNLLKEINDLTWQHTDSRVQFTYDDKTGNLTSKTSSCVVIIPLMKMKPVIVKESTYATRIFFECESGEAVIDAKCSSFSEMSVFTSYSISDNLIANQVKDKFNLILNLLKK